MILMNTAKHCNTDLPLTMPESDEVSPAALVYLIEIATLPVTRVKQIVNLLSRYPDRNTSWISYG